MAQCQYDFSDLPTLKSLNVHIIRSKWHKELSDSMVSACLEVFRAALGKSDFSCPVHTLPGSLELSYAAQTLLNKDSSIDAIVAFGVILKGDTDHYELVRNESAAGLRTVSMVHNVPIINEILPVHKLEDAEKRTAKDKYNKGYEAGIAAVEAVHWKISI